MPLWHQSMIHLSTSIIMCLWYVQKCPDCECITAFPNIESILCDNGSCRRRPLDRFHLSEHERVVYLEHDTRCCTECTHSDCGLAFRIKSCGMPMALRRRCLGETDSEAEPEP